MKNAVNIKNSVEGLGSGVGNLEAPEEAWGRGRAFRAGVWRV